ncbi:PREDICTED: CUB and sushi domain-containing protein 2-like, partial [Branchiostoma belcheri]|uniref:CUB and sushi domain-containing protein 2-like n=1 Tax=Branchiostoma belcheri TaxID=7741 RepID=A0A6P4ZDK2_BRABE
MTERKEWADLLCCFVSTTTTTTTTTNGASRLRDLLENVLNEDGLNWGRVITAMIFALDVRVKLHESQTSQENAICSELAELMCVIAGRWLLRRRGWSGMIDAAEPSILVTVVDIICLTSVTGCGGDLTAPSGGPVTSPNYPSNYGNNENCEWSITVPEGSIIRLTFDSFYTERNYDFLTIYDGASDNAAEMGELTGEYWQISPIISTSNTLFLRFTSDWITSRQGFQFSYISRAAGQCWDPGVPTNGNRDNNSNFTSGQTVRYTCMDGYQLWGTANITCQPNGTWSGAAPTCEVTSGTGCGGDLTAPSGGPETSPNYPGNYGNNENCEWSITVPEGSIIRLTFDRFYTERNYDFLTIYDGAGDNAAEMERLTGHQPHISPIISTSNTLFLRFTSDGSASYQGFQFNYT